MEADRAKGITQSNKGNESNLILDRSFTISGEEIDHIRNAVFKAGEDEHRDAKDGYHCTHSSLPFILPPNCNTCVHKDTAHKGGKEDVEERKVNYDASFLCQDVGRADAKFREFQASSIKECAYQVSKVDDCEGNKTKAKFCKV